VALACLLASSVPTLAQLGREGWRFQSGIEIISIPVSVFDADGRIVADLPREAFEVYDDGERQEVSQFTSDRVPLSVGILLDVSDSMYGQRIRDARAAVERFLELLNPADEFFLIGFNHRPRVLTEWTADIDGARRSLNLARPFGGTAVYDAVMSALPLIEKRSRQRAALLLISDGADTASDVTLSNLRRALHHSDAFGYALAIDPPGGGAINTRVNPEALREITNDSGGRTEVVHSADDLSAATARIADELNHQYVLGYAAPRGSDGQYHSIRVRVNREGFRVRARSGYIADPRPPHAPPATPFPSVSPPGAETAAESR
jgi:Ca-activated chloride channel family protein